MAPDSPAAQLERAEDGLECDPDQEEEEEEDKGEEAEAVDEEASAEAQADGAWAGPVEQVEVELQEDEDVESQEDEDVEELAEELSPTWGTQECLSRGGDARSLVLRENGKRQEPARREGGSRSRGAQDLKWEHRGPLTRPAAWPGRQGPRPRAAVPNRSFPSALQAPQGAAVAREEDLDEDEDEELEDEDEEDFLTAGSQVSCPLVWSSVKQAGFPQGAPTCCPQDPGWQGSGTGPQAKSDCDLGHGCRKRQASPALRPWDVVLLSWG